MLKWIAAAFGAAMLAASVPAAADQYVQGHMRSDGTYVQGYMRSSPDSYKFNNYGSQGNSNPYTGQRGSERNEFSSQPSYNSSNGRSSQSDCYYNCKSED